MIISGLPSKDVIDSQTSACCFPAQRDQMFPGRYWESLSQWTCAHLHTCLTATPSALTVLL